MKRFRFLITLLLVLASIPVMAAEEQPTDVRKLLDRTAQPKHLTDYANLYYQQCIMANKDPKMKEYIESQCACTASNIPANMTMDDMNMFMRPGQKNSYYYTRLITLAYMPCVETTMKNYIYDTCMDDPRYSRFKRSIAVCTCLGKGVANMATSTGAAQLPGYQGQGYDMTKITDNPFPPILDSLPVADARIYYTNTCVQTHELKW